MIKNYITLVLLVFVTSLYAQTTYVPDDNFENGAACWAVQGPTTSGQLGAPSGSVSYDGFAFDLVSILDSTCYAGEDSSHVVCGNIGVVSLSNYLSANVGDGYWESDNNIEILEGGLVDFASLTSGNYSFIYTVGTAECSDEAIITISVEKPLSPGENGTFECSILSSEDQLFSVLGGNPDPNGRWEPGEGDPSFGNAGIYHYLHDAVGNCPESVAEVEFIMEFPDAGPDRAYYLTWGLYDLDVIISEAIIVENNITNKSLSQSNASSISVSRRWQFSRTNGPLEATIEDDGEVDFPNTGTGGEVEFVFIYTVENDCGETDDAEITFYLSEGNLWPLNINICPGELLNKDALFASIVSFHGGNISLFDGELRDINFALVNFPVGEGIYSFAPNYSGNVYDLFVTEQECFTKVFLQGPYNTNIGLMNDDLRINGMIPLQSPYSDELVIDQSILSISGNNAIVDWIWVELRDNANSQTLITGKSALLQRDGDIVVLDGVSPISISVADGDYYIVMSHRNHLGIQTVNTVSLLGGDFNLDATTNSSLIFGGTNAIKDMGDGNFALYAGDANGDGIIQYSGATPEGPTVLSYVLNHPSNFLNLPTFSISGYSTTDLDMDGQTQYAGGTSEMPVILQNVLTNPANFLNLITWPIEAQLPETAGKVMKQRTAFKKR